MLIACPACQTRYNVPDSAIGAEGRTVRCAKCGNSWFAAPEDAVDDEGVETPAPPAATDERSGHDTATQSDEGSTEDSFAPASSETTGAQPATPAPPNGDGDIGEPAAPSPAPPANSNPPANDSPADQPAASPVRKEPATSELRDPYEDWHDEDERPRSGWKLWIIALLVVLAIAGAVYGAARLYGLPDWVPIRSEAFSDAPQELQLDFPVEEQALQSTDDGGRFFTASGTITNTGSSTQRVPPILVVLRDSHERIVYSSEMIAPKRELEPGERVTLHEAMTDIPRSARVAEIGWKSS